MTYLETVYQTVKKETEGFYAIYGDYIRNLVGITGLEVLIKNRLLESCGAVNGRQLYVLCEKK